MTPAGGWTLVSTDRLDDSAQAAVRRLNRVVSAADHAPPLNEDAVLRLSSATPDRHHRVLAGDGGLLGYAQYRMMPGEASTADIAVGLVTGRLGSGTAQEPVDRSTVCSILFDAVEGVAVGDLLIWSHGDRSPVNGTAVGRGYLEDRVLLAMARPAPADADAETRVHPPAGIVIRPFVPGVDDAAWLLVNQRAFADHPEQGRWRATDLAERISQPWFDPAGFFLAVDEVGAVVGFHWTKVHEPPQPDESPIGEVYVIGIDPDAQGRGLGGLLLRVGLHYLDRRGVAQVILYTDESNRGAVALYERTGFVVVRREVQFRRPSHDPSLSLDTS